MVEAFQSFKTGFLARFDPLYGSNANAGMKCPFFLRPSFGYSPRLNAHSVRAC